MRFVKPLSGCALVLLFTPVHAADTFPDFPLRQASAYTISAHQDDLTVGLQTVESSADQKTYFHADLTRVGFVPVMVVIHNGSTSQSVLVDKSKISCDLENGSAMPKASIKGAATAEVFELAATPVGGGFAWPVVAEMFAKASHVQHNLIFRELHSQTISPGESAHGFLYFPVPKTGARPKIHVAIPVQWTGSDRTSVLNVSF